MCEFCIQHGEGKQWYLQMKNYSNELLHATLSPEQRAAIGFTKRIDWVDDFIHYFTYPACPGSSPDSVRVVEDISPTVPAEQLSPTQQLARNKIEHFGQVIPIEDVEKVLGMSDSIVRMPCGCRLQSTGLANQRYCFGLGIDIYNMFGKYPDSSASLEVMTTDDATKLIRKFDEEGLMHSVWTGVTPYVIGVCNCDTDCGAYRSSIRDRGVPNFFRAEYICQVDVDQCNGCKECVRQCQFAAMFYSSSMGKVDIAQERCFGCGVCRAACPQDAISLIPRVESPVAAPLWLND